MLELIYHLLSLIEWQSQIIKYLCVLIFGKNFKPKAEKCTDKEYMKLSVDPMPIFGDPTVQQIWQYTVLLKNYREKHGKDLKPVSRRGGVTPPEEAVCPYCGAPPDYV